MKSEMKIVGRVDKFPRNLVHDKCVDDAVL